MSYDSLILISNVAAPAIIIIECTLPLISDFKISIQQLENGSLMNYHSSSARILAVLYETIFEWYGQLGLI